MDEEIDVHDLHKQWVHSHEEDVGGNTVYRTSDYSFPRSRGRVAMALEPDGTAEIGFPGRDDRSRKVRGRWRLEGRILTVERPDGRQEVLEIESLQPGKLIVRKI